MKWITIGCGALVCAALAAPGAALAAPLYNLAAVGGAGSRANDINALGQMVGVQRIASGGEAEIRAYYYDGTTATDLSPLVGLGSSAERLNDSGTIVGLVQSGSSSRPRLPMRPNNHDQVVGEIGAPFVDSGSQSIYPRHAFLDDSGVVTDLGAMLFGGGTTARDINDNGQIVGATDTAQGRQAFLYATGSMVLLDALIDPALGWTVQEANGINERGQIAGTACRAGLCYAVRLDLATAVPEPAAVRLLAVGLLARTVARHAGHAARSLMAICRSVVARMLARRRHPVGWAAC
jgi:probable HAF family extracellular repeat protein